MKERVETRVPRHSPARGAHPAVLLLFRVLRDTSQEQPVPYQTPLQQFGQLVAVR